MDRLMSARSLNEPIRVYLSMPMSGHPGDNREAMIQHEGLVKSWFSATEEIEIVNPGRLPGIEDRWQRFDYRSTLVRDLRIVAHCDAIFAGPGAEHSLGCCAEIATMMTFSHIERYHYAPLDAYDANLLNRGTTRIVVLERPYPGDNPFYYLSRTLREDRYR